MRHLSFRTNIGVEADECCRMEERCFGRCSDEGRCELTLMKRLPLPRTPDAADSFQPARATSLHNIRVLKMRPDPR